MAHEEFVYERRKKVSSGRTCRLKGKERRPTRDRDDKVVPQMLDPLFTVRILDFEEIRSIFDNFANLPIDFETKFVTCGFALSSRRVDVFEVTSNAGCNFRGSDNLGSDGRFVGGTVNKVSS